MRAAGADEVESDPRLSGRSFRGRSGSSRPWTPRLQRILPLKGRILRANPAEKRRNDKTIESKTGLNGMENLKAIIETLIFVSDAPLPIARIRELLEDCERGADHRRHLRTGQGIRRIAEGGLLLQEVAGGYQFRTNPQWSAWAKKLKGNQAVRPSHSRPLKRSPSSPTASRSSRRIIERMRGVDCEWTASGFIGQETREDGRSQGRPGKTDALRDNEKVSRSVQSGRSDGTAHVTRVERTPGGLRRTGETETPGCLGHGRIAV